MRGVLGVRGDKISNAELFFMLYNILGTKLFAFRHGYSTHIRCLEQGADIKLNTAFEGAVETPNGVRVSWTDEAGRHHTEDASGCVVTTRADMVADFLPGYFDEEAESFLRNLNYTKCILMNTGVVRKPPGINASVVNIPQSVDKGLMGFTCEHNKAPGRAPKEHGLLSLLTMTEWAEELIDLDDDTIRDKMLAALEKLIPGVSNTVDYTRINRWNEVIVYSRPGLYRDLGKFLAKLSPNSAIQLAGVFRSSSNLCTATVAGEEAAAKLISMLSNKRKVNKK